MKHIKVTYQSLTDLSNDHFKLYSYYLFVKANVRTAKDGFISKKEYKSSAQQLGISLSNFYKQLNKLCTAGFISKNKYGFILTSHKTILNNLNFKTKTFKTKTGIQYAKVPTFIMNINSPDQIELLKLYHILLTIGKQREFKTNGKHSTKIKLPENLKVSLTTLMDKGQWLSKTKVYSLIKQLHAIGLITIHKNGYRLDYSTGSPVLMHECNTYTLHSLSKANWLNLKNVDDNNIESFMKSLSVDPVKKVKVKSAVKVIRKKVVLSDVEKRFIAMIERYKLQFIDLGLIKRSFLTRKFSKRNISPTLNLLLSNEFGLKLFYKAGFTNDNVMIGKKEGLTVDNTAEYSREKYVGYTFDYCTLVSTGGNYNGRIVKLMRNESLKALMYWRNEREKNKVMEEQIWINKQKIMQHPLYLIQEINKLSSCAI